MDSIQSNVPKLVWTFYFRLATQPGDNTINNSADLRYQGRVTCHLGVTGQREPDPRYKTRPCWVQSVACHLGEDVGTGAAEAGEAGPGGAGEAPPPHPRHRAGGQLPAEAAGAGLLRGEAGGAQQTEAGGCVAAAGLGHAGGGQEVHRHPQLGLRAQRGRLQHGARLATSHSVFHALPLDDELGLNF